MPVTMDDGHLAELEQVNAEVNAQGYVTDQERFGVEERWQPAGTTAGDCEDLALEKRNRLRAAGYPDDALRMATCTTETGEAHAVLTVDVERNGQADTVVLDNRRPDLRSWNDTGYTWIARQDAAGAGWSTVGG